MFRISSERCSRRRLLGELAIAIVVLAMVVAAILLTPDPRGFGTHTQLGLEECSFRVTTGKLCPACGLTTSFSAALQGRFGLAFRANAVGPALLLYILVVGASSGYQFVAGRKFLWSRRLAFWSSLLVGLSVLVFGGLRILFWSG